jgi:MOSC domain-containing protein YiiM
MPELTGRVVAVCLSERKGTPKRAVEGGTLIPEFGLENDAHGGKWHRQVSLLDFGQVEAFNARGARVGHGAFGENLVVSGLDLKTIPVGSKITIAGATLEVTQIGKECHSHCEIFHRVGDCIMPREGIFAKVLIGGEVQKGDLVTVLAGEGPSAGGSPGPG